MFSLSYYSILGVRTRVRPQISSLELIYGIFHLLDRLPSPWFKSSICSRQFLCWGAQTLSLWSETALHKTVDSIFPYMGIGLVTAGTWPYADGPCTYMYGAPTGSEIPNTFAWGRKAPIIHSVPRGGRTRVLFGERLCTRKRRFTQFTIFFAQARYPVVETES